MRFMFAKILLLPFILGAYFISCRSTKLQTQNTDFEIADEQTNKLAGNQTSDQESGATNQQTETSAASQKGDLKSESSHNSSSKRTSGHLTILHPKEPTAWFTRRLLMTTPQPTSTEINNCRERAESTVKDAPNLAALDAVALALETEVGNKTPVYHWCFYQIMADLDIRLDNNTPLMQDKADIFLSRMKTLWALARSLDSTDGQQTYIKYLRARYTEISQNIFGRNLETVDLDSFRMPTTGAGKSASEFEE
jgi:hypothetical protein